MSDREERRKDLTKRIFEKIASDPQFRETLVTDPAQALSSAGFSKEIHALEEEANQAEVSGYAKPQWFDSWGCIG